MRTLAYICAFLSAIILSWAIVVGVVYALANIADVGTAVIYASLLCVVCSFGYIMSLTIRFSSTTRRRARIYNQEED